MSVAVPCVCEVPCLLPLQYFWCYNLTLTDETHNVSVHSNRKYQAREIAQYKEGGFLSLLFCTSQAHRTEKDTDQKWTLLVIYEYAYICFYNQTVLSRVHYSLLVVCVFALVICNAIKSSSVGVKLFSYWIASRRELKLLNGIDVHYLPRAFAFIIHTANSFDEHSGVCHYRWRLMNRHIDS